MGYFYVASENLHNHAYLGLNFMIVYNDLKTWENAFMGFFSQNNPPHHGPDFYLSIYRLWQEPLLS